MPKATASRIPDYFGHGGRLAKSAADALIHSAYAHDCRDADILLPGLHEADLAHAIALIEGGVVPKKVAPVLLRGLLALRAIPLSRPAQPAARRCPSRAVAKAVHCGRPCPTSWSAGCP